MSDYLWYGSLNRFHVYCFLDDIFNQYIHREDMWDYTTLDVDICDDYFFDSL